MKHSAIHIRAYLSVSIMIGIVVSVVFFDPSLALAKTNLDVAVWIPYWQEEKGISSATKNLRKIDTVHPFVFGVRDDGSIKDFDALKERHWLSFIKKAKRKKVEIIPTLMWFKGSEVQSVLSNRESRSAHIELIAELVKRNKLDGIDIDYEGKLGKTTEHYSLFLKELKDKLGKKVLTCTIEARTPPESKWREVPTTIQYANDFKAINKYCDRVEIMAYDQQRIDWKLNSKKNGEPYIPVADVDWVEKVVKLALDDIDADKIMLGVPTYGREWILTVEPEWLKEYKNVTALNMPEALKIAKEYKKTPSRNKSGEMSFTYFPKESPYSVLETLPTPNGTSEGNEAVAKALLFATASGMSVPVNVVWYSDAGAIESKVKLAEKYGLRGIAIFKIDGKEDKDVWKLF